MAIKNLITDPRNNNQSWVNSDPGEDQGLVVATRPLKTFDTKTVFFTSPTYGREMAQDAAFGGTALLLHDGTDTGAWTFSEPTGTKWTADSTDEAYADSKSLKCDNPNVNDIMQIINNVGPGDDISLSGNYVAITFWINVDKDWISGDSFSLYAHVGGVQTGDKVLIENYFDYTNHDIWQYVNIPLSDMGLSAGTIDAFRIENEARSGGKSPEFYIDEWYLQASGTPIDFTVEPDKGTWFHVKAFQTTFVDAYDPDEVITMHDLSYNKILGMTPTTGYIYKRYSDGNSDPIFEARITNLMDLLSFPYSKITNTISDGTNSLITIENSYPPEMVFTLKSEELDKIVYTIEDNFSELLYFRISAQGYVETR